MEKRLAAGFGKGKYKITLNILQLEKNKEMLTKKKMSGAGQKHKCKTEGVLNMKPKLEQRKQENK